MIKKKRKRQTSETTQKKRKKSLGDRRRLGDSPASPSTWRLRQPGVLRVETGADRDWTSCHAGLRRLDPSRGGESLRRRSGGTRVSRCSRALCL